MTKVNPNNRNQTKSDIFSLRILKYVTSFLSKRIKYFSGFQNRNLIVYMCKINPNNRNKRKPEQ